MPDRVEETARLLRDAAAAADMAVSGDQRVAEADAARLLGIAPGSLKNLRAEGRAPKCYLRGLNGCRISYRLDDLAQWVEDGREDY
jgi:hypothetical protein